MSEEQYKNFSKLLQSSVSNLSQSFYDSYVAQSASFARRSGYNTTITRRVLADCCQWCTDLAGTYEYGNHPADIFKRHAYCRCLVTYNEKKDGSKGYTDVWSKKEFDTQRDARLTREREIERELYKNKVYKTKRVELLEQNLEKGEISKDLLNDFSDMEQLSLSEKEKKILINLNKKSSENGFEYGKAIYEGGESNVFTDEKKNVVSISNDILEKKHVNLYHSHTNETTLSTSDLKKLCFPNIDSITNISINGNAYSVEVGAGYRPSEKDFEFDAYNINSEIDKEFFSELSEGNLNIKEYYFKAIRESLIRISSKYGWTVKGGELIE